MEKGFLGALCVSAVKRSPLQHKILRSFLTQDPSARFVQHDEKLPATVHTLHRGKQDRLPRPVVHRLPLAVRALDLMPIEIKIDKIVFRHDRVRWFSMRNGSDSRTLLDLRSGYL